MNRGALILAACLLSAVPTLTVSADLSMSSRAMSSKTVSAEARGGEVLEQAPSPSVLVGQEGRYSLLARLPWSNPQALLGWGSIRLSARPGRDELAVSAIVDAPSDAVGGRWHACRELVLRIDGASRAFPVQYVGRPMPTLGTYDAIHFDFDIAALRAITEGEHVSARVCGDPLSLRPQEVEALRRFIEHFDRIAEESSRRGRAFYREVGPFPRMPHEPRMRVGGHA